MTPSHAQFASTKRFTAAVALINETPPARFPHLLSRVLGRLHAKTERVFSAEEEAALCELFGFSADQLELLLSSCSFIFEQAAYMATAPAKLGDELLKAGVEEAPATAFGEVWQQDGAQLMERLREQAVLAPTRLSGVDWQMCVGTSSSDGQRAQESARSRVILAEDAASQRVREHERRLGAGHRHVEQPCLKRSKHKTYNCRNESPGNESSSRIVGTCYSPQGSHKTKHRQ